MECCNKKFIPKTFRLKDEKYISKYLFLENCPKCNQLNIELYRISFNGKVLPIVKKRGKAAEKIYNNLEPEIHKEEVLKFPDGTNNPNWRVGEYLKTKAFSATMDGCRQENAYRNDRIDLPELKISYECILCKKPIAEKDLTDLVFEGKKKYYHKECLKEHFVKI